MIIALIIDVRISLITFFISFITIFSQIQVKMTTSFVLFDKEVEKNNSENCSETFFKSI